MDDAGYVPGKDEGPGTTYTLRVSHGGVGSILRGGAGREEALPGP